MNDPKLNRIFAAARREVLPTPPEDFARGVAAAARQQIREEPRTLLDQLGLNFPRYAMAAGALIVLCIFVEVGQRYLTDPDAPDEFTELYAQWLFTAKGS